jgi:hypothetical protein
MRVARAQAEFQIIADVSLPAVAWFIGYVYGTLSLQLDARLQVGS